MEKIKSKNTENRSSPDRVILIGEPGTTFLCAREGGGRGRETVNINLTDKTTWSRMPRG